MEIPLFMIRGLIGAILAGISLGLLGAFVLRLNVSLMGVSITHSAFAGAALGIMLGTNPLIAAVLFALLVAGLLGPISEKARLHPELIVGITLPLMMALGFIFIVFSPGPVIGREILSLFWGSVLGLSVEKLELLCLLTFAIVALILIFRKEFLSILLDRKLAKVSGINAEFFFYLILFLLGVAIAFNLKLVGGLLIYALLVLPAAAAFQFSCDMRKIMASSPLLGMLTCLMGFFVSYVLDWPIGSTIVIVSASVFLISVAVSPKRRIRYVFTR